MSYYNPPALGDFVTCCHEARRLLRGDKCAPTTFTANGNFRMFASLDYPGKACIYPISNAAFRVTGEQRSASVPRGLVPAGIDLDIFYVTLDPEYAGLSDDDYWDKVHKRGDYADMGAHI